MGKVFFQREIHGVNFYFGQLEETDHDFRISCYRNDGVEIFDEIIRCTALEAANGFVDKSNQLFCLYNLVTSLYLPPCTDGRTILTDIVGVI